MMESARLDHEHTNYPLTLHYLDVRHGHDPPDVPEIGTLLDSDIDNPARPRGVVISQQKVPLPIRQRVPGECFDPGRNRSSEPVLSSLFFFSTAGMFRVLCLVQPGSFLARSRIIHARCSP